MKSLPPRQRQILNLAKNGLTDKEMGRELGLSEGTIRTYWDRLRTRYGARSRSEILSKALLSEPSPELDLALVDRLPIFVWTATPEGEVDFCNQWFALAAGLPTEDALGAGCSALMPLHEREQGFDRWRRANDLSEGYEATVNFKLLDGQLHPHLIRLVPVVDAECRITKWIGMGRELECQPDDMIVGLLRRALS